MLLGCIADDFTGASDLANTLAKNGMATVQFSGVPSGSTPACEAGVIALKTRSIPPSEAVAQSLDAFRWLQQQGCTQYLFKYCSTFDSTPEGNIGPVAEALLAASGAGAAIVCPAFPATGRTLYNGHLFVNGRLLNESGMENHPLNPMTDPNIRRWLKLQTKHDVGLVTHDTVRQGAAAICSALELEAAHDRRLVVVDAITNDDLLAIGAAAADQRLVTGGSGIALGLPENFRRAGKLGLSADEFSGSNGFGAVLSGSCSTASQAQVAQYLKEHPGFAINPRALLEGRISVAQVLQFVRKNRDADPLVYSTADPAAVQAVQDRFGRERVAHTVERFFGELAKELIAAGTERLVVGGGETSGAVVTSLQLESFVIGPEIDPGVPSLVGTGPSHTVRLALKSGNFGSENFYEKASNALRA